MQHSSTAPTLLRKAALEATRWTRAVARPEQVAPTDPDWQVWLILSGRGWGKTRTGAEWITANAAKHPDTRWAIVAPTFADARDTCVEGVSGVRAVLDRYGLTARWNRSLGEIDLKNGSKIKLFSADEPDRLRGPQHHGAWCDEMAAWRYMETWDQLRFGLRLGQNPQTVITTTPKPNVLLRALMKRDTTHVTRGSTFDNAANLSPAALAELRERYEGTRLGRQELYGEVLDDVEGALFPLALIDKHRVTDPPELEAIVVGVDPAVTANANSDDTGIITVGRRGDHLYVLADHSLKDTPDAWARAVVQQYHASGANYVIVETNNGGDLIKQVIRTVDPTVPLKTVTATRGKYLRAEPIGAMYEQGKVHHVGVLPALEEQMSQWVPGDPKSPDRLDALVYACMSLTTRNVAPVQSFAT